MRKTKRDYAGLDDDVWNDLNKIPNSERHFNLPITWRTRRCLKYQVIISLALL